MVEYGNTHNIAIPICMHSTTIQCDMDLQLQNSVICIHVYTAVNIYG